MRAPPNPTGLNTHSPERTERMCALYRSGWTLQEIGDEYGITRERVRQVIGVRGLKREHGGVRKRAVDNARRRRAALESRWDPRYMEHFGADLATVRRLNGGHRGHKKGTLAWSFHNQKNAAKHRGVAWELTFPEWIVIWELSGHLHERGRGYGYCMARKGDTGPYAIDNVYITTCAGNAQDAQSRRRGVDYSRIGPATNDPEAANG